VRETQATIWDWRLKTFGQPTSLFRILTRANEEMAELLRKVAVGTHSTAEIAEEAADIVIVLFGAATSRGFSLADELPAIPSFGGADFAVDANRELSKAIAATQRDDDVAVRHYLRGTYFCLIHFADYIGMDLGDAIDAKMAINRTREWKLDGTGHGYHKRDKAEEFAGFVAPLQCPSPALAPIDAELVNSLRTWLHDWNTAPRSSQESHRAKYGMESNGIASARMLLAVLKQDAGANER